MTSPRNPMPTYPQIAKMIDHALLAPSLTTDDLEAGLEMSIAYDVASVCILPYYVRRCAERLSESSVKTSTTIGFPHGATTTHVKQQEAAQAIADGCQELDMVVNISKVLSGDWEYVATDIAAVIEVAHAAQQQVKVIFENAYLQPQQMIRLCEICTQLRADWVKTSTGFATSGATESDVTLMRKHVGPEVQVKAAGGIRDLNTLLTYRNLGVTRVGASATQSILDELRQQQNLPPIDVASRSTANGY